MLANIISSLKLAALVVIVCCFFDTTTAAQDIRIRTIQEFGEKEGMVRDMSLLIHFTEDQRVIIYNYEGDNLVYDILTNSGTIERKDGGFSIILGVLDKKGDFNNVILHYSDKVNIFNVKKDERDILTFTFKPLG